MGICTVVVTDATVAHLTQTLARFEHKGNCSWGLWPGLAPRGSRKRGEGRGAKKEGWTSIYLGCDEGDSTCHLRDASWSLKYMLQSQAWLYKTKYNTTAL